MLLPPPKTLLLALLSNRNPYECLPATSDRPPILLLGGTRNLRDVLDDVDVRGSAWYGGGRVHTGMLHRTQRLWERHAELRAFCLDRTPPLVTGWSLGGGVGVCLAALLAEEEGVRVPTLRLFGAPRVGDAHFARWYEDLGVDTVRYETPRDPISRLPRAPYVHVGRAVQVPAPGCRHHDMGAYLRGLHLLESP